MQIIADGGPEAGYGHVGRCLAIAEQFGENAVFAVEDETVADFVRARGARVLVTSAPVVLIDRREPTDASEVKALQDSGQRVVLLDDSGTGRDTADLVIDPPTAARWPPTLAARLAGFEHALLRREVRDVADTRRGAGQLPRSGPVLIAMGGSDPTGATPVLAAALALAGIEATIMLGPGYRGPRSMNGIVLDRPELFVPALADASLLIASYGHSLLEAAHLGVPAIAVVVLPEHAEDAAAFCANGTAVMLDMSAELRPERLVGLVHELQASAARRAALSARGIDLIDGRGAERVARAIRALTRSNRQPHPRAGAPTHAGPIVARNEGWNAIDCRTCGWVHLDPMPDADELATIYKHSYYRDNPGWLQKELSEQTYWDLEHADKLSDWGELLGSEVPTLLDVGCSSGRLLEVAAAARLADNRDRARCRGSRGCSSPWP